MMISIDLASLDTSAKLTPGRLDIKMVQALASNVLDGSRPQACASAKTSCAAEWLQPNLLHNAETQQGNIFGED